MPDPEVRTEKSTLISISRNLENVDYNITYFANIDIQSRQSEKEMLARIIDNQAMMSKQIMELKSKIK